MRIKAFTLYLFAKTVWVCQVRQLTRRADFFASRARCAIRSQLARCSPFSNFVTGTRMHYLLLIRPLHREREGVREKDQYRELHVGRGLTFSQALLLEPNRPELHLGCSMPVLVVLEAIKFCCATGDFLCFCVQYLSMIHAHVRRGQCLMQLDKLEDALTSFEAGVLTGYFLNKTQNCFKFRGLFQSVCPGCPSAGFTMHLCTAKQGTPLHFMLSPGSLRIAS